MQRHVAAVNSILNEVSRAELDQAQQQRRFDQAHCDFQWEIPTSPAYSPTSPAYSPTMGTTVVPMGRSPMGLSHSSSCTRDAAGTPQPQRHAQQQQQTQLHAVAAAAAAAAPIRNVPLEGDVGDATEQSEGGASGQGKAVATSRDADSARQTKARRVDPSVDAVDFTKIPTQLDKSFEALDLDAALRPTNVKVRPGAWTKLSQKSLLARKMDSALLGADEQKIERDRAFDLLEALSKSGALSIDAAELHVLVCASHCFDKSVMDTIIENNVNPIEKVERSSLIVASTVLDMPATMLVKDAEIGRLSAHCGMLIDAPMDTGT